MTRLPGGVTVKWLRRVDGELSPRGNPVEGWAEPVELTGCGIAPMTPQEQEAFNRDPSQAPKQVYTDDPAAAQVGYRDRLQLPGSDDLFEVIGDAEDWVNPYTGRRAGTRLNINLWKG